MALKESANKLQYLIQQHHGWALNQSYQDLGFLGMARIGEERVVLTYCPASPTCSLERSIRIECKMSYTLNSLEKNSVISCSSQHVPPYILGHLKFHSWDPSRLLNNTTFLFKSLEMKFHHILIMENPSSILKT